MYAVNRIARKLKLAVPGLGNGGGTGGGPKSKRPLRIEFTSIQLPSESRRVNYGERMSQIELRVVNQTDAPVNARLRLYLVRSEGVVKHFVKQYLQTDVRLRPHSKTTSLGPFEQLFTQDEFPERGQYGRRAKLVSLDQRRKGDELHTLTRYFYLEEDPPQRGLFEQCEALEFPDEVRKLMAEAVPGESGGYILQYNVVHPAKLAVEDNTADFKDYLVHLMANEMPWSDIRSDSSQLWDAQSKAQPENVARRSSHIISEVLHAYYT